VEGLRGKGDIHWDEVMTVDEINTYVPKKVPEVTGQNQNPVKKGEVEAGSSSAASVDQPQAAPSEPVSPLAHVGRGRR
jgi:hypothetical protein